MQKDKYFILDFDSTFTKVEALDELGEISLRNDQNKEEVLQQIKDLTNSAMNGTSSFSEGLTKRLQLLKANRNHLQELIAILQEKVSDSIHRNKAFFEEYADQVLIVSSGFKEFIVPIVLPYGIKEENVHANTFKFDAQGNIIGYDEANVLCQDKGKIKLLDQLGLSGDVYVLGDGYTDYEIKEAGLANRFYAFTENVVRDKVVEKAEHFAPTLEEFLYQNKLPMAVSYPKNRIKVLLLENIHPNAVELFKQEGYQIETIPGALSEDELCEQIRNVSILGIRSKTQVTARVLECANRLMSIGAFCIGTNQIDLEACLKSGITVFNAPFSNTRSVVELALGEIIMLSRRIFDKSMKMHQGTWDKTATGSIEVRDKKLGIVGYGNIGAQLSVLAEAVGMQVYYYDVVEKLQLGNARKCESLQELLQLADFVTLHVDGSKSNTGIFGKSEFDAMKPGAIFLNLSRGHVVEIPALVEALRTGKLGGAAVDVFPYEPATNDEQFVSELRGLPNVILTPHIGGSTTEAQENIARFVPNRIMQYINTGNTYQSVNFPNIQLPELKDAHRLIHIHSNVPGVLANINNALAQNEVNILGQYLKTNEQIGYVITDIDKAYDKQVISDLRKVPHTIKFRILY